MSLEPYRYRPATPDNEPRSPGHSRNSSGSSIWSSPGSHGTRATTPCRSPSSPSRNLGPVLLPKLRAHDQNSEPDFRPRTHRRALSTFSNPPEHARPSSRHGRPGYQRSTTSPPECTPISASSSTYDWTNDSTPNSTYTPSARGYQSHSRSVSNPAEIVANLPRWINPTYRTLPIYTTRPAQYSSPQYTPAVVPEIADFVPPKLSYPTQTYRELTPELECSYGPTTTITSYLTSPNPPIRPVARPLIGNGIHLHCWWDIRNIRPWSDFDIDTISSVPGFSSSIFSSDRPGLLTVPIEAAALPASTVSQAALEPTNERALQDIFTRHFATKINAATKTCQGHTRHITMRAEHSSENGPHFLSSYANDLTHTLSGNGKGRVVGLVKAYEVWNTGMRHTKGQPHVKYLSQLAHLQRVMREHNTRYGFLITEIELVCVRLSSEGDSTTPPYFGLLHLSAPIPLARHGEDGKLTAAMALWYLHMLAADVPLEGQLGWKVEVGPPVAVSRNKVLEGGRDAEMQAVGVQESRIAKTRRGWVWPGDGFHRLKEGKGGKRGGA